MVRIIVSYRGISRIVYEGYDVEIGLYIKKTLSTVGLAYVESVENREDMVIKYIEVVNM